MHEYAYGGCAPVASERRVCKKPKGCGNKFSRPLGSRRIYCEACRPPRARLASVPDVPASSSGPGPIEVQVLARLEAAERVETIEGQLLLRMAQEADGGRTTAAQLGSLAEKLLRVADVALAGTVTRAPDELDEITARRRAKAAAAS